MLSGKGFAVGIGHFGSTELQPGGEFVSGDACFEVRVGWTLRKVTPVELPQNPIVDLFPTGEVPITSDRGSSDSVSDTGLGFLQQLNRRHLAKRPANSDLEARIASFELAFRMQMAAPEATNLSEESEATKKQYGLDSPETENFGRLCLQARRFAERGVRFIQVSHAHTLPFNNEQWDQHTHIEKGHSINVGHIDKPITGLIQDLRARGLLDDTLVVWGGEFGRTPTVQVGDAPKGRDHHPDGFTMWMAGGGVKKGFRYGATDDFGYHAIEDRMTIHDWHATILHLMGLSHTELTYHHTGRDFRLTDVFGSVAYKMIESSNA